VTQPDAIKLSRLLEHLSAKLGEQADLLRDVLDLAEIVPSETIPPEVATLHSKLDIEDRDAPGIRRVTLVLPHEADAGAGRISVVSPAGRALLGRVVGDVVEVQLPNGSTRRMEIKSIPYQPEANGIHELP
jgi:regulator of nucleoside diphosphate kinase